MYRESFAIFFFQADFTVKSFGKLLFIFDDSGDFLFCIIEIYSAFGICLFLFFVDLKVKIFICWKFLMLN